jgi:hypothetical protein
MLERFRARPPENDPAVVERKAARLALSQARKRASQRAKRDRLAEERNARRPRMKLREEEAERLALEQAERDKMERRAEGDRALELLAEQKAARDSRYAARQARRR